jgi:hypothetical protein
MPIRITKGTIVQMTSMVVFSWNCAAFAPALLRCLKSDQNIAPKTITKIATQTHRIPQCRS